MTSLAYGKLELLICLNFPMAATGINKEGMSLYGGREGLAAAASWPPRWRWQLQSTSDFIDLSTHVRAYDLGTFVLYLVFISTKTLQSAFEC